MDLLSATGSIIAVLQLSVKILGYLNDIKDASKDRTQCATEISNLYALFFNLRARIEEGNFECPWYRAVQALTVKSGPIDQFKDALELLQTRMTASRNQLKKASEPLVWKFQKGEVASILSRIERLKTLAHIALEMDHFKLSKAIHGGIDTLQALAISVQSGVDSIRQDQELAKHRMVMEWMSPTDYPAQQSDIINRRQRGTGGWFLETPEVVAWLNTPKETLLCLGIPGAGKTMVAAITIDHLIRSVQNTSVGIAYVYCNYKAQQQNTTSFLAAITKQLVLGRPSITGPLERLHMQHADRGTKPSLDEIFGALKIVLASYSTVYVVVDGLDECRDKAGTHRRFPAKLRSLQAEQDLRLMATSRSIPDIVDGFRGAPRLEVKARNEDVRLFVAGQMYRQPQCIQSDAALQDMVQNKITEAADGVFLLARLHADSLLDKRTKKRVKVTLSKLAKGSTALDNAYQDALHRIEGQPPTDSALAKRVLSWITYARRPLKTVELLCALAVESEERDLDCDNILAVEDIVLICAGLVTVDEESDIIRLAHYTTQEYFERIQEKFCPKVQLDMAQTCLKYLNFNAFRNGACPTDQAFESRLQQNVFLDYAAKHWGYHAETFQDKVYELACSFLLDSNLVLSAIQAMSVSDYRYSGFSQDYPKKSTGLHVTAHFGLPRISEELFLRLGNECVGSIDAVDGTGRTPLLVAVVAGHDAMIKLLLEKGGDVNGENQDHGHALYAASIGGNQKIVEMLLKAGANVNVGGLNSALVAASRKGHEQVVKILLDAGAKVNSQVEYNGSALYHASHYGHEGVATLLLKAGADVNEQGGYYGNALQVASSKGHKDMVKLLLNASANITVRNGLCGCSVQAPSARDDGQVVKMLLEKDVDRNIQAGCCHSVLQAASVRGDMQAVRMMLNTSANINSQRECYVNALYAASLEGHKQVVKLLLEAGVGVNARCSYYGSPLYAASREGHKQVVKLLLDAGADVNSQGGYYGSALYGAAREGHKQVVKLLLDAGAYVTAQNQHYSGVLQDVSRGGFLQVCEGDALQGR